MILLPEDAGVSDDVLPRGVTDINGHQLDLRTTNSWVLKMEEVSTPEIMEVSRRFPLFDDDFSRCLNPFFLFRSACLSMLSLLSCLMRVLSHSWHVRTAIADPIVILSTYQPWRVRTIQMYNSKPFGRNEHSWT